MMYVAEELVNVESYSVLCFCHVRFSVSYLPISELSIQKLEKF